MKASFHFKWRGALLALCVGLGVLSAMLAIGVPAQALAAAYANKETALVSIAANNSLVPLSQVAGAGARMLPKEAEPESLPEADIVPETTQTQRATYGPIVLPTAAPAADPTAETSDVYYSADFSYLNALNEDVRGWLVQDGTTLNYPIMQAKDNTYYAKRMFNRNLSTDGSIYMDSANSPYFLDTAIYLYGYQTKTNTMFGTLESYAEQAYYDEHAQMFLLSPYGDHVLDLFAARKYSATDDASWRVPGFARRAEFDDFLDKLKAESLFDGKPESMPNWGDQLVLLVTSTSELKGERIVVYARMRKVTYTTQQSTNVTKLVMDQTPSISGFQEVPGRGPMMVYAQNDPLWDNMRYEIRISSKKRTFGEGGCGPTSIAMAVANLVSPQELTQVAAYAKSPLGYTFCQCSVNQYFCTRMHVQYQLRTPEEYLRYFPLVMGNFATGNNVWEHMARTKRQGTALNFLDRIAEIYNLNVDTTYDNEKTFDAVRNGAVAIGSLGKDNPFTGGGHYIVIAYADDEYAYFLDPYRQEDYEKTDKKQVLTQLAPGVVRVKRADARKLGMATIFILTRAEDEQQPVATVAP